MGPRNIPEVGYTKPYDSFELWASSSLVGDYIAFLDLEMFICRPYKKEEGKTN